MTEQINVPKLRFGDFEGECSKNRLLLIKGRQEEQQGQLTFIRPALRFKADDRSEFPDWEEKRLGDVATIGNGRDYKHLSDGDIPVFGTGGYMTSVDEYLHDGETVFIGRKGTINKPYMFNGKFWTVDTLFYTKEFKGILPKFVYAIFQKINWSLYNEATGVPSLSKGIINKIRLNLPTLPEQQKIASFLSKVDEKIALLTEKKDKLTEYKKGVMQQLFNGRWEEQQGQLTFIPPTLRFKADDGSEFPDWEEVVLGELCKINTGKLDANAMVESGEYRFYTCAKQHYKIDKYAFDTEALLISGNGANVGYIHYYNGKFNAYQRTYVLDSFDSSHIHFIKCFLERNLKKRIMKEKNEGNTPYIVLSTLKVP